MADPVGTPIEEEHQDPLRRVVDETDKRLIFLQEVGGANYELLESLLQGKELESATLEELREAMERHFQPKKLILAERFAMMSKAQKTGQTLQEYFAEVQKAANECMFEKVSDVRDAMVTIVFIGGLASVETRKRLLEKEHLTSKEALEVAEAFERVGKNAPHLKEGQSTLGISAVRTNKMPARQSSGTAEGRSRSKKVDTRLKREAFRSVVRKNDDFRSVDCRICGKRGHIAANCYLRGKAHCRLCSKPGHIARTCWSKRPQAGSLRKVNWCAESDELDSDSEESILLENVHTINMLQVGRELTKKLVTRRSRREVLVQRWRRDPESLVRKSDTRRSRCEVPAELLRQEELNEVGDI
ncbi:hypothetical protein Y032_0025g1175 [Ancylostoma ceylanicum]|uniref:CCHC-type domain-containing protein n=1 Tax=Ancylostoma ceylanicum TaxID=53326 RepID=A0A016UUL1_9BILA|nr:hypothetical protein Y032_0025g1175 [Ancylostoma ceylanicum]